MSDNIWKWIDTEALKSELCSQHTVVIFTIEAFRLHNCKQLYKEVKTTGTLYTCKNNRHQSTEDYHQLKEDSFLNYKLMIKS